MQFIKIQRLWVSSFYWAGQKRVQEFARTTKFRTWEKWWDTVRIFCNFFFVMKYKEKTRSDTDYVVSKYGRCWSSTMIWILYFQELVQYWRRCNIGQFNLRSFHTTVILLCLKSKKDVESQSCKRGITFFSTSTSFSFLKYIWMVLLLTITEEN